MSKHLPGTRAARRVDVKYPPPGLTPEQEEENARKDADLREAMAGAAMDLVLAGEKPTIPAVVTRVVDGGGKLSVPHATRKAKCLGAARRAWEELHGRQPEWHRRTRGSGTPVEEGTKEPEIANGSAAEVLALRKAIKLAERRFARAREELEKTKRSRDRLAGEVADLREQVRRFELRFTRGD